MRKPLGKLGGAIVGPLLRAATLFMLISSALCHAQCATYLTNISSITPSTLMPGKTTNITVLGQYLASWYPAAGVANGMDCEPLGPYFEIQGGEGGVWGMKTISAPPTSIGLWLLSLVDGSQVSSEFGTVAIDSWTDSEITASVTPGANDPAQTACVFTIGDDMADNGYWGPWGTLTASSCRNAGGFPIQIGCTAPTISSVTPSIWLAGKKSGKVVLIGTGFITEKDAAKTKCPVTSVTITAADGSSVPISSVSVDSKQKITLTGVAPPAIDPNEQATVTAGTAPNTGTYPGPPPAQILGNQIQCDPSMSNCGGTTISVIEGAGSPPTTKAVVGQQIILNSLPLPTGIIATKTTWKVGGTKIAGYDPSTGPTNVAPFLDSSLDSPNINFYWVKRKDSIPVTYEYCVNIPGADPVNQCSKADAEFDVSGPESAKVFRCGGAVGPDACTSNGNLGKVAIGPRTDLGPGTYLSFGGTAGTNLGIVFTSSDDASSPQGTYSFVQLINTYNWTYSYTDGQTCSAGETVGLDNRYPVPMDTPTTVEDNPAVALFSDDTEVTASFNATMYAMWTPSNVNGAIPVPLGNITWGWDGDSVQIIPTSTAPQSLENSALSSIDSSQETVSEETEDLVSNAIQQNASKSGWSVKKGSKGTAGKLDTSSAEPTWGYPTWGGLATATSLGCFK